MHLGLNRVLALVLVLGSSAAWAQVEPRDSVGTIDVDFLLSYYDQDGDRSSVTGGIGTEDLQVITPIVVFNWRKSERWSLQAELGVDSITSASTDNIDLNAALVSGASRQDARAHTVMTATRSLNGQAFGVTLGLSNEYDYQSINGGVSWSKSLSNDNASVGVSLHHYSDTVELYDIEGILQGDTGRQTTDLTLSASQIFSTRTWGSAELYLSDQSGFLSTPFHEVILAPTTPGGVGARTTERLPDSRFRTALGLRLNHSFSNTFVQRISYRFYDDDWGIQAHSIQLEPHFRISAASNTWLYPILRFHTQTGSDYFGPPETFTQQDSFFTADGDLGEFDSEKFGVGFRTSLKSRPGFLGRLRSFETRLTSYSRDDGLDAIAASFAFGWTF